MKKQEMYDTNLERREKWTCVAQTVVETQLQIMYHGVSDEVWTYPFSM